MFREEEKQKGLFGQRNLKNTGLSRVKQILLFQYFSVFNVYCETKSSSSLSGEEIPE